MNHTAAQKIADQYTAVEIDDMIAWELDRHPSEKTREWSDHVDTLYWAYQHTPRLGL